MPDPTQSFEEQLKKCVWYGSNVMDDKPHQFWRQMELAAELLGDAQAARVFRFYYEKCSPVFMPEMED